MRHDATSARAGAFDQLGTALRMLLVVSSGLTLAPEIAAAEGKSGEQVYREVCAACHEAGVNKAPKFGDRKAWGPLIKEGQHVLTAHAWVGVRGMPARGGRPDLTLEEFARGAAHMARAAGGTWKDPDAAMLARIREEEQERIKRMKAKK